MSHSGGYRVLVVSGKVERLAHYEYPADWDEMVKDDTFVRYNTTDAEVFRVGDVVFTIVALPSS